MLLFFKRLRKGLIEKEDIRKYLLYGLGEVLLVMIGILLALQVNNWRDGRKERAKEHEYLKNLKVNLESTLFSLESEMSTSEKRIAFGSDLKQPLPAGEIEYDAKIDLIWKAIELSNFTPHQYYMPAYDDLKSSGNLPILRSEEIKAGLAGYSYRVNVFESMIYRNTERLKQQYEDVMGRHISPSLHAAHWEMGINGKAAPTAAELKALEVDIQGLLNDPKFHHYLEVIVGLEAELKVLYGVLLKENVQPTIDLVVQELKKFE